MQDISKTLMQNWSNAADMTFKLSREQMLEILKAAVKDFEYTIQEMEADATRHPSSMFVSHRAERVIDAFQKYDAARDRASDMAHMVRAVLSAEAALVAKGE